MNNETCAICGKEIGYWVDLGDGRKVCSVPCDIPPTPPRTTEDILKEFDRKFVLPNQDVFRGDIKELPEHYKLSFVTPSEVKSFLLSALASQRREVVEEVEKIVMGASIRITAYTHEDSKNADFVEKEISATYIMPFKKKLLETLSHLKQLNDHL